MVRSVLILACIIALLLAACGDDSEKTTSGQATTGAASTHTTTTAAQDGIDPMDGASSRPIHVPATNRSTALLTDVRAARHEGFDRVVFQFRDELPGYDVRYVSGPVHEDGSGNPVPVADDHVVRIRMENALDADLTQPSAPRTYDGPRRLQPGTPVLAELASAGGFEGVLTWVAGLRDRVDFRVTTLDAPARLVVDFRNH